MHEYTNKMKILILGEFSGFARHLKNGFQRLGHEVTVVQNGDGWKKLESDDDILYHGGTWHIGKVPIRGSNRIKAVEVNLKLDGQLATRCPNPDLIIVINYVFLRYNITRVGVSMSYIQKCLKRGTKVIMSECGTTPAAFYNHPELYSKKKMKPTLEDKRYSFLLDNSTVIIPTTYHYYDNIVSYSAFRSYNVGKVNKAIPLPITVDGNYEVASCLNRRIVIFHGLIRPDEKGSQFIQTAMERLEKNFPDRVECIVTGGLPYDEYVKLFDRVDILVDQTYGNGWGINAMIGAAKGKCILTATGKENEENMGIQYIPFVKIIPDSEQIYQVLKKLILNPCKIDVLKNAARDFAVTYCDSEIIAKRYMDAL